MALPSLAAGREPLASPRTPPLVRLATALVAYGPALIILTLPLEFTAGFLRQQAVRWVAVVVALAFAYLAVTGRRSFVLPRQRSAWWMAAFVAFSLVSWILTRPPGSLKEVADVAAYPIFGILILNLVDDRQARRRAWTAFLISGLGVAVLGFGLYVTHHTIWTPNPVVANRLNITFADPNITARFLTMCAAAAVLLFSARRAPTWLTLATGAACAVVVPMTYSRSGLALFIVFMVVAAAFSVDWRRAAAVSLALLVVFALSTEINPATRQRAADAEATLLALAGTKAATSSGGAATAGGDTFAFQDNRKYLIAAGLKMFEDHPVAGVGFGGYEHALTTTYRRFIPADLPNPDIVSHTVFVTIAAEEGVLGLALILGFLVQLGREVYATRRNVWVMVPAATILCIVLYSQFEARFIEEPYLWLSLALLYAAMRARGSLRSHSHTM